MSHAGADQAEVEQLAKTLADALEKDSEAMVMVRARVVASLLGHLVIAAERES